MSIKLSTRISNMIIKIENETGKKIKSLSIGDYSYFNDGEGWVQVDIENINIEFVDETEKKEGSDHPLPENKED